MDRDIVFICLDSVRKDVFDEVATRTRELADVSFDNCRAASSWSAPSHASMISGLLAHEHGVTTHSRSFDSLSIDRTMFDSLRNYRTIGISGNLYAGPHYHFDQYFDSFFTLSRGIRFPEALHPLSDEYDLSPSGLLVYLRDCVRDQRTYESLFNGVLEFVDSVTDFPTWMFDNGAQPGLGLARKKLRNSTQPSFVFLNLMEGHIPYQPGRYLDAKLYDVPREWSSAEKGVWELIQNEYDEQYWSKRNQLYRATVDYLDRCIAEFVRSVDERTTIIVTADHGDNLGTEMDECLANHKSSLSEGLLHVPFCIVNAPETHEQTGEYLSHLAVPELISGCRQGSIPDLTTDRTFAELGGMSAGPDPEDDYDYYDRAIRCAYDGTDKIVWDSLGTCSHYHVDSSKANWQRHFEDIDEPPLWAAERFSSDISTFKTTAVRTGADVPVDESTARRLKELGYL